ncbi:hypothetical protein [Elongatibacter sediminis]|uniref:Lipocalin-like domain-containing protein n=1 Tax=Elongatibacter sediminis TaxID=3119006 RepID=A0AAW9RKA2_9GAMM
MHALKIKSAMFLCALFASWPLLASDPELYGVWEPIEYVVDGTVTPLRGAMIVTPGYLVANAIYDGDGDGVLEANATSGPITVANNTITYMQWVQLHYRPSGEGNELHENVEYDINYTIEDDRLIFHFPSGNRYISKRLAGLEE